MAASLNKTKDFKSLYKTQARKTPGSWKNKYRQRCFENIRRNRRCFVDRLRDCKDEKPECDQNITNVKDVMRQEWMQLKDEDSDLPDVVMDDEDFKILSYDAKDVGIMLTIFDEIQEELKKEERRLIEEYERNLRFDEQALCASIESLHTNEVICPMCCKSPLMQNKAIIFCNCGLRVDTEQDCISLEFVKSNLEEGVQLHSKQCCEKVVFGEMKDAGIDSLIMTCTVCDFMHIVI